MLTSGLFWGLVIILIGIAIILKALFGINFPIVRLIIGLVIIYFGIRIITGGFTKSFDHEEGVFMGDGHIEFAREKQDYSIVFGKGTIDLRKMKEADIREKVEASIIFGSGTIIIPEDYPLKVELSAAFGKIKLDDKAISGIGNSVWYSDNYQKNDHSVIKANAVFGDAKVITK